MLAGVFVPSGLVTIVGIRLAIEFGRHSYRCHDQVS